MNRLDRFMPAMLSASIMLFGLIVIKIVGFRDEPASDPWFLLIVATVAACWLAMVVKFRASPTQPRDDDDDDRWVMPLYV